MLDVCTIVGCIACHSTVFPLQTVWDACNIVWRFAVLWHVNRNYEFGAVILFAELHVGVESITYNCHTVCRSLMFLELECLNTVLSTGTMARIWFLTEDWIMPPHTELGEPSLLSYWYKVSFPADKLTRPWRPYT